MTTTNVREALAELVGKALNRAWSLGQTYWQQADSASYRENARAHATHGIYEALREETLAALASHPSPAPQSAEPMAQAQAASAITEGMVERASAAFDDYFNMHAFDEFTSSKAVARAMLSMALHLDDDWEPIAAPEKAEAVRYLFGLKSEPLDEHAVWINRPESRDFALACSGTGRSPDEFVVTPLYPHPEQKAEAAVPAGWADEEVMEFGALCIMNRHRKVTTRELLDEYRERQGMPPSPTGNTPTEGQA